MTPLQMNNWKLSPVAGSLTDIIRSSNETNPKWYIRKGIAMKHFTLRTLVSLSVMSAALLVPGFEAAASEPAAEFSPSFVLEGETYTLPFDYSDLEANGWTPAYDVEKELGGMTATDIAMEKDSLNVSFGVLNGSGNAKPIKDCQISEITVGKQNLESFSYELTNGLKPGDDLETIIDVMGEPDNRTDYDDITILSYGDEYDGGEVRFGIYNDEADRKLDYISLYCYQAVETETSSDLPEYLSEYEAPSAMRTDFSEAMAAIDQLIYQLPCPVSVFEENGWSLADNDDVMAQRNGLNKLEKDGFTLEVTVTNFADLQMPAANCAVTEIRAYNFPEAAPGADLVLPYGISFDSTKEDLDAVDVFEAEVQDEDIVYTYRDLDNKVYYTAIYDSGIDCISFLSVRGDEWSE